LSRLVKSYIEKALQTSENLIEEKLEVVGELIVSNAKPLTPVKYGRAKGSITWATSKNRSNVDGTAKATDAIKRPGSKLTLRFGSAVEYFKFLELGTRYMKRFAPLRLGFYKSLSNVKRILAK